MSVQEKLLQARDIAVAYGAASKGEHSPYAVEKEKCKTGVNYQILVDDAGEAAKFPQYLAAIIGINCYKAWLLFVATLGGFICGTCLGWTSPTMKPLTEDLEYGFPVSDDQFSWIGSIMPVGAAAAGPLVGWMVDAVGRKNTILILIPPAVIGWAFMIWSESVTMFCVGRFICGVAGGGYTIAVPLYTSEYAEKNIRGTLGTYFQLQLNSGILFTYILGSFLDVFRLTIACAIIPIAYGVMISFLPESPIYYLKTQRRNEAKQSLQWFRGKEYNVETELSAMQKNIEIMKEEQLPFLEAFSTTAAKRGLVICLGVMAFSQFSGVYSVVMYLNDADTSLDPNLQSIVVGAVSVLFSYISTTVVDRVGRRPLLLISDFFMAICTFFLGLYFFLKLKTNLDISSLDWLPITSVCVFIMVFSLGYGSIPLMLMSEVFPRRISGYACSLTCMFDWGCTFLVTRFFGDLNVWIGIYGSFWLFSIISTIGTTFVYLFVPETKGKTLEEVQIMLGAST